MRKGPTTMRRLVFLTLALAAAWTAAASPARAEKLRIVTSTTDLKALTEAVTGDLADVDAMARPNQNAHDLEVRPSLMIKVRRAYALIVNGLELDGWADVVAQGANNSNVIPGAPGRIDASRGLNVLEVPKTRVDRSMGDVHPQGNPHYTLDPGLAPAVTQNILEGLARLAPQQRPALERNRQQFLASLEEAMGRWNKTFEPHKGAAVVVGHTMWIYFLTRFGLVQVGTIEERPQAHRAGGTGRGRPGRRARLRRGRHEGHRHVPGDDRFQREDARPGAQVAHDQRPALPHVGAVPDVPGADGDP